jgi:hypothetical protein
MKTFAALAALLLAPVLASAQAWRSYVNSGPSALASAPCAVSAPIVVGGTQGYADSLGGGKCYVSIHPMAVGMIYRDYAFFDDGMLMVFNSYGDGEGPGMTSAREFYFFPRSSALALEMNAAAGTAVVRMSDGGRVSFAPATAQIASVDRGAVTVSPRIDPAERGGVEFSSYSGLMLDAGFRMGELPSGLPDGESTFRSAQGQLCRVKNREIFTYAGKDHSFKFDDAALSAWLKTRCPGLAAGF